MTAAIVTGAGGGIGSAICEEFSKAGWTVIATDVQDGKSVLCEEFHQIDLTDSVERDTLFNHLSHRHDVGALVNNAAIQFTGPLSTATDEDWSTLMNVNVKAAFQMLRSCLPLFYQRPNPSAVVNIASVHSLATSTGMSMYAASKGALMALTRAVAIELADDGIRCNAVLPGAIETSMLADGFKRSSDGADSARRRLIDSTPLHRIGSPSEVAKAVLFLADGATASFITGQSLVVDGGATARLSTE